MVTLLHVSDLHFGSPRAQLLAEAVLDVVGALAPDALVCSGDLVEWGETNKPWRQVRAFLDRLTIPALVVPGNHDLERLNPLYRLLRPWARYHRFVSPVLDSVLELPGALIVGLGTPRRWCLDLGHISRAQLAFAEHVFSQAPAATLRVVAMHHGLRTPHGRIRGHVWGSGRAAAALLTMGTDLVLSGHRHHPHIERLSGPSGTSMLWAQAGSAGSHRLRHVPHNSISLVRAEPGQLEVEWWNYDLERQAFVPAESSQHPLLCAQLAAG